MTYCDKEDNILSWGSEEVVVPYISPVDNKPHRYYVDFIVEVRQKDGTKKVKLILLQKVCLHHLAQQLEK